MNINQAMAKIYADASDKAMLDNAFYVCCLLSDMCHETFEDQRMVKAYGAVARRLSIFGTLLDRGMEKGLEALKNGYNDNFNGVSDVCEFADYKKLVFAVVNAIDPSFRVSVKKKQEQTGVEPAVEAEKKKHKTKPTEKELLKKKCEKLASSFYDYFCNKYWSLNAIHFIRRSRILKRGYGWWSKIIDATDGNEADSIYKLAKNVIDAI